MEVEISAVAVAAGSNESQKSSVAVDSENKATEFRLMSIAKPHMRAFHLSWISFFSCFVSSFAAPPLLPIIRDNLNLTATDIGNAGVASVSGAVFARVAMGTACDLVGPRLASASLILLTAPAVYFTSLINSATSYLLVRFFTGFSLATFVSTQFWMSSMFSAPVVGRANGFSGGWGNLGGGATQLIMPLVFSLVRDIGAAQFTAWRIAFFVPAFFQMLTAFSILIFGQDTPDGNFQRLKKSGQKPKDEFSKVLFHGVTNYRGWILALTYGYCFGVELTIDNIIAEYFYDRFNLKLHTAGIIAANFGLANLFSRPGGGFIYDAVSKRFGMRGRLWALWLCQTFDGVLCIILGLVGSLSVSVVVMIIFSVFVQATCGMTFGIVPFVSRRDLSFNKLSGTIPSSFSRLLNMNILYLTGNLFTGPLPNWIANPDYTDLSYNNFSIKEPELLTCQQGSVNLFASSMKEHNLGVVPCLGNINCSKPSYSLHINCGGKLITSSGNITYDEDTQEAGPARSLRAGSNWAVSNTGHFFDSSFGDYYTWSNTSKLTMNNAELYTNARVSALSLTYYGFCMRNGSYTVHLHFAEIMFTDDQTYSSLGRRVFDIYIQKKLVLKDFDIAKEAGGVRKAIIKKFIANVTGSTLEIRLQWAGKGTTAIPFGSVYGPLISAISVNPDFMPPVEKETNKSGSGISVGDIVVIVIAGALVIVFVFGISWWRGCLGQKGSLYKDLQGLDLKTNVFTLRQIKTATNNFDIAYKIGQGGFGTVYKGVLSDGTVVAVKQFSSKSRQGNREFINEIGMISALQHPCLVKLYGCCMEGDQLLLIYEYMENNSLARALFAQEKGQLKLDWSTRRKICLGVAKGLAYLHGESRLKIVHRDIKATNVLLDKDLNPKISDFGLAKLDDDGLTHISTRVAGTYGYMAPEYAMRGYLTDKADVYSFGIVALEVVSGKSNNMNWQKEECFSLLDWALLLKEKGDLLDLVDERLGSDLNENEAMLIINVALLCSNFSSLHRPTMSSVVRMLEGKSAVQEAMPDTTQVFDEKKLEMMRNCYQQRGKHKIPDTHEHSTLIVETAAFMTNSEVHSANMDSSSWEESTR